MVSCMHCVFVADVYSMVLLWTFWKIEHSIVGKYIIISYGVWILLFDTCEVIAPLVFTHPIRILQNFGY